MEDPKDLKDAMKKLLKRLDVFEDSVLVLHESDVLPASRIKTYLASAQAQVPQGTVCVISDCAFNSDVALDDAMTDMSNQERLVLASGKLLQLLTLNNQCIYASHPALMFGSIGKYSRYFARHNQLDFPYGPVSVFQDLYDLDAVILCIGTGTHFYETKFAYSKRDDVVIRKNTTCFDYQLESYLDYDAAEIDPFAAEPLRSLFLYETFAGYTLYGIHFQELIDQLVLHER